MKRHALKVCSLIRMLISTLQFTASLFLCCNVFKTAVANVSFRAGWCDCCMQCLVLFRKILNVDSIRHSAHTLILFHSLYPVLFCSVLQHTKCDGAVSSCSDDLHLWLSAVFELLVSAEIRREKFGLCWSFVCKSQDPAKNSDLWFLNLSFFVRAVSRTLVLEFLSCRASPQEYLRMHVGGMEGSEAFSTKIRFAWKPERPFLPFLR